MTPPTPPYTIVTWNIRGVWRRLNTLTAYVLTHHPTVICLQEAFPGRAGKTRDIPRLSGYRHYANLSHSGLITYVKSKICHQATVTCSPHRAPLRYLSITVYIAGEPVHIVNVHNTSSAGDFNYLPHRSRDLAVLYVGDLNAKHHSWGDQSPNRNGSLLYSFLHDNPHLKHFPPPLPSHVYQGHLDHFISNNIPFLQPPSVTAPASLVSDHFAQVLSFPAPLPNRARWNRKIHNIPQALTHQFKQAIEDWFTSKIHTSPEAMMADLQRVITTFTTTYVRHNKQPTRSSRPTWATHPDLQQANIDLEQAKTRYISDNSATSLREYLTLATEQRTIADTCRSNAWADFLRSLNAFTPPGIVWQRINQILAASRPPSPTPPPNAQAKANELMQLWTTRSSDNFLPRPHLAYRCAVLPSLIDKITTAITSHPDPTPTITNFELHNALSSGRSTAPGLDGITYDLLRTIASLPNNPLLHLFNLSLSTGLLPSSWTESFIIPIPKPNSTEYRPISLTSCVCKTMERIILSRLHHTVLPKLSPSLHGFLPGHSTQNCLAELYAHSVPTSCTAYVDLRAAFDTADHEIILAELVDLGVSGPLLRWIRGYLSNRTSFTLFEGARSATHPMHRGTPQGGVLSPFLFNILMNRVVRLMRDSKTLKPDSLFLCYADDICISTNDPQELQNALTTLADICIQSGLIINTSKTFLHTYQGPQPQIFLNGVQLNSNPDAKYLGIPLKVLDSPQEYIKNLKERLLLRLRPLRRITPKHKGADIPTARSFYILYIRALVDYHALSLALLPDALLAPLETVQNHAMRAILSCPRSTRIVNMREELQLQSVTARIRLVATTFASKILHHSHRAPTFSTLLRSFLTQPQHPTNHHTTHHLLTMLRRDLLPLIGLPLDAATLTPPVQSLQPPDPDPYPPWDRVPPDIAYTQTPPKHMVSQTTILQTVNDTVNTIAATFAEPPVLYYTDGAVSSTGETGAAFTTEHSTPTLSKPPRWSSSTLCELHAICNALQHYVSHHLAHPTSPRPPPLLIITDSQSALACLSHFTPRNSTTKAIVHHLRLLDTHQVSVKFLWIPSHIGYKPHDIADKAAKSALQLPRSGPPSLPDPSVVRRAMVLNAKDEEAAVREAECEDSITIPHHDWSLRRRGRHTYGRHTKHSRACDVAVAWLRLGYRQIWEIKAAEDPDYTDAVVSHHSCRLCDAEYSHSLTHYVQHCPVIRTLMPLRIL